MSLKQNIHIIVRHLESAISDAPFSIFLNLFFSSKTWKWASTLKGSKLIKEKPEEIINLYKQEQRDHFEIKNPSAV